MKKTKFSQFIVSLLFLAVFNAIFFLFVELPVPESVWIAYGVIHVSYLLLIATSLFAKPGKFKMEHAAPLAVVSLSHFLFQLIAGIIIMLIAPEGYKFVLVFYIITLAIYLFVFFSVLGVNGRSEAAAQRQAGEVFYIRNHASKVKMLMGRHIGGQLDRELEKVYDELYTSPTRSCPGAAHVEANIAVKVNELEKAMRMEEVQQAENIMYELLGLIAERNRIIKINY